MKLVGVGVVLCAVAAAVVWRLLALSAHGDEDDGVPSGPRLVAHDSSGHDNDGVNQGAPVLGLPGHRGTSYSFDKRGSWVEVPSTPKLNPGLRDFAFSAWVSFSATPKGHRTYDIIRKGLSFTSTGEFKLEIVRDGAVRCTAKDLDGTEARITGWGHAVTDGRWHDVGCARAGRSWEVRVDGWSRSKTVHLGPVANSMPLSIGSKYGLQDMPEGRVDEVRLVVGGQTVGLWHLDERSPG